MDEDKKTLLFASNVAVACRAATLSVITAFIGRFLRRGRYVHNHSWRKFDKWFNNCRCLYFGSVTFCYSFLLLICLLWFRTISFCLYRKNTINYRLLYLLIIILSLCVVSNLQENCKWRRYYSGEAMLFRKYSELVKRSCKCVLKHSLARTKSRMIDKNRVRWIPIMKKY